MYLYGEQGIQKRETSVKQSRNPEFNETLLFNVFTNTSTPLDMYSLLVTINSHNKFGKDEVLGHVIFSVNSPQLTATDQWEKIKNVPHKQITGWHTLVDPSDIDEVSSYLIQS